MADFRAKYRSNSLLHLCPHELSKSFNFGTQVYLVSLRTPIDIRHCWTLFDPVLAITRTLGRRSAGLPTNGLFSGFFLHVSRYWLEIWYIHMYSSMSNIKSESHCNLLATYGLNKVWDWKTSTNTLTRIFNSVNWHWIIQKGILLNWLHKGQITNIHAHILTNTIFWIANCISLAIK